MPTATVNLSEAELELILGSLPPNHPQTTLLRATLIQARQTASSSPSPSPSPSVTPSLLPTNPPLLSIPRWPRSRPLRPVAQQVPPTQQHLSRPHAPLPRRVRSRSAPDYPRSYTFGGLFDFGQEETTRDSTPTLVDSAPGSVSNYSSRLT